jgi:salicylate hydroxylase
LNVESDPIVAFHNFRRVRIPRVHAVQRRSAANARIYHLHDRTARDALLRTSEARIGSMEWIVAYDPVGGWDANPTVPAGE